MIEFLFLDLDDTILDFHKAERIALSKTIRDFGIEPTEEVLELYHEINDWHWKQLELGNLTRTEVLVQRCEVLFEKLTRRTWPSAIISCPVPRRRWTACIRSTGCFWPATAPLRCSTAA